MRRTRRRVAIAALLILAVALLGCDPGTARQLALASNAVSIGLDNVQEAVIAGVNRGVIPVPDAEAVNAELRNVAQAGLALNQAIRDNLDKKTVDAQLDVVLIAFDRLVITGAARIANPETKLAVSTALNSARVALATIAATVRS